MNGILTGLKLTISHLFDKPITRQYPKEKPVMKERFRGRPGLIRDIKSREFKCVACGLCAKACPDSVIKITPGTKDDPKKGKKKYPIEYTLDLTRCMFCGYCVEACPFGAIIMTHDYELATYNKSDLYYDLEKLAIDRDLSEESEAENKNSDS